ncbi:MAG: matrixin family metalloprotease [Deltaproteobacteria bacterium]|nr:matrixin family metalloprotease [Deltaproteobacteria bacterium]
MRLRRAFAFSVTFLAVASSAVSASAYCRTTTCDRKRGDCRMVDGCPRSGAPVSWPLMPIPYRFHAKPPERLDRDEARGAVRLAFQRWSEVICPNGRRTSLRFEEGPEIPASRPRGREPYGIYFRDDGWPHDDVEQTLALTTQLLGGTGGVIRYADIEINSGNHDFALRDTDPGKDLEAVITHEVGHYIGLAHSPESDSIMVASYCQSATRCSGTNRDAWRDLGDDDIAAVCALYPPERAAAEPTPSAGCAVASSSSSSSPPGGALLAGAAMIGGALVRVIRRRRGPTTR